MFQRLTVFIPVLFFLALPASTLADPSFKVSFDKPRISLDEKAILKIEIVWPKKEGTYQFGLPDFYLHQLTLTNRSESQETFVQGEEEWTQKIFAYELAPQSAGEGRMEGFPLLFYRPGIDTPETFQVSDLRIEIKNPGLFDAKPLMKNLILMSFLLLGVTIGGFLILFRHVQNESRKQRAPDEDFTTIERFRAAIEEKPASREGISQISHEFRNFLVTHYSMPSSQLPESEILERMKSAGASSEELRRLQTIFQRLTEAKFMGQDFMELDLAQLKKEVSNFIQSKSVIGTI